MDDYHQVLSKSLDDRLNIWKIVAGTGTAGSTATTLYGPKGIYVDFNLTLYVADCLNNRIQRFRYGELNGTTIVGTASSGTISLYCPVDLWFDADGYMFILEHYNHRIIRSGPSGFFCIVACTGALGSTANHLHYPTSFSFDSYGNIYVADYSNHRLQKFTLISNRCSNYQKF